MTNLVIFSQHKYVSNKIEILAALFETSRFLQASSMSKIKNTNVRRHTALGSQGLSHVEVMRN
jgi:hypothetical protein